MATPINSPQGRPGRSSEIFDKALPHNLEAERSVLGAILLDNSAAPKAFAKVESTDFFLPQHRYIARSMKAMSDAGTPIDTVTLMVELQRADALDAAGGVPYLSQLADGLPRVTNVEHYAEIVFENAVRRYTITEAYTVMNAAQNPAAPSLATVDQLETARAMRERIEQRRGVRAAAGDRWKYSALEFLSSEFPEPEQLIARLFPKCGTAMIVAMPHHLKSWFMLALAMGATKEGLLLGQLEVPKPVRTLYFAVEDNRGDVRKRMRSLVYSKTFADWNPTLLEIWTRPVGGFDIMQESHFAELLAGIKKHQADLVIIDVLRRIFRGDINSPKESAQLCEQFDRLRDSTGASIAVVHHENRKGEDIMRAAAGSFNFAGWADVTIQLKRKIESGNISRVEIHADYQLGLGIEPMSLILDLTQEVALRMESLEEVENVEELRQGLGEQWTVRDLAEFLDVHKSNAHRRIKKLRAAGLVEKVKGGKRGISGLARYCFVQDSSTASDE